MPLSPARYKLQVTISDATHDKLRRLQDLMRHTVPSGDVAEILDRALTLLLDDGARTRCAEVTTPRQAAAVSAPGRHIPAAVKRAVWKRDGGRCAFVGSHGQCSARSFLQFHHVRPFAAGGESTVENIELRCQAHNLYESDLFFGCDIVRERPPTWGADSFRNELGEQTESLPDAIDGPAASTMTVEPGWRNWQTLGT